jgi:hypothetical protein
LNRLERGVDIAISSTGDCLEEEMSMGPNPFLHTQQCDEQVGLSDVCRAASSLRLVASLVQWDRKSSGLVVQDAMRVWSSSMSHTILPSRSRVEQVPWETLTG